MLKRLLIIQIVEQALVSSVLVSLKLVQAIRRKMKASRTGCSVLGIKEVGFMFENSCCSVNGNITENICIALRRVRKRTSCHCFVVAEFPIDIPGRGFCHLWCCVFVQPLFEIFGMFPPSCWMRTVAVETFGGVLLTWAFLGGMSLAAVRAYPARPVLEIWICLVFQR